MMRTHKILKSSRVFRLRFEMNTSKICAELLPSANFSLKESESTAT